MGYYQNYKSYFCGAKNIFSWFIMFIIIKTILR